MKYTFLLLIFSLVVNGQIKKTDYKLKLMDYFNCIKTENKNKFVGMLITESEYNVMARKAKNINLPNENANKSFDSLVHIAYLETVNESIKQFEKVITNSKKLGIPWNNIVLDSIVFKTETEKNISFADGKIYFRNKDNSSFYFMNLIDFGFYDLNFIISKLYSPAEDIGSKNRFLTKHLKEEYITNLSKLMKQSRAWSEEQYVRETEMTDGVEKVKYKIELCKKELAKKK